MRDFTFEKKLHETLLRVQKLEALSLVTGGIAHDFNNMLTAIIGNICLIRTRVEKDEWVFARLGEAEKAAQQARELASQLLTFSRQKEPAKKIVVITELLKYIVSFSLRGTDIQFQINYGKDIWPVEADEGQLTQVVQNLIINAKQAMMNKGFIRIGVENIVVSKPKKINCPLKNGNYIRISIKDEGAGISNENLERIFEPFFSTKKEGTGLGLSMSRSIVEKHGGALTVESVPGAGTTFSIYLPASVGTERHPRDDEKTLIFGKGKVLIIDEQNVILDVLGKMLEYLGYESDSTQSAEEGIAKCRHARSEQNPFSVLIFNLTFRGETNWMEALKRLREIDPGLKLVASTGKADSRLLTQFQKYGLSGVLSKPFTLSDVSKALYQVTHDIFSD